MKPRLLYRTHYQVTEPKLIAALVLYCTSPVSSEYRERVAIRISQYIEERGGKFNADAGKYAVDMALNMGLLTQNLVWTWKAHLIELVARKFPNDWSVDEQQALAFDEQLTFMRLYLDADVGVMSALAKLFLREKSVAWSLFREHRIIEDIFKSVAADYAQYNTNIEDRIESRRFIQEIERLGDFKPNTKRHKVMPHLTAMYRLGLIDRQGGDSGTYLIGSQEQHLRLERFVAQTMDIEKLEHVFSEDRHVELIADVQAPSTNFLSTVPLPDTIIPNITNYLCDAYNRVMQHQLHACPLATMIDYALIQLLARDDIQVTKKHLLEYLESLRRTFPKKVRIHVDGLGRPAFIVISPDLLRDLLNTKTFE